VTALAAPGAGPQGEEEIVERDVEERQRRGLRRLDRLQHLLQQAIAPVEALATLPLIVQQALDLRVEVLDDRQQRCLRLVRHAAALGGGEAFEQELGQFAELPRGRQVQHPGRAGEGIEVMPCGLDTLGVARQGEDAADPAPDAGDEWSHFLDEGGDQQS